MEDGFPTVGQALGRSSSLPIGFMRFPILFLLLGCLALLPARAQTTLRVTGPPVRLIDGGRAEVPVMRPLWSPDGRYLALSGPGYQGLWLYDREDGTLRRLTDAPAAGFGFSWSADGTTLLARVARFEGLRRYNAIVTVDVATGRVQRVGEERTLMPDLPRWAPDDRHVLLYRRGRVETLDTGKPAVLTPAKAGAPVLLSGGGRLQRVAGTAVTAIHPIPDAEVLNVTSSPQGAQVAFEVLGGNLYVMNSDGTGLVDLGPGHRPQWSPDGRWVVFMRTADDGYRFTASDLYAARADGSATVRLTHTAEVLEMNPAWSPDGAWIAFDDHATGDVYLLPVAE